ncbi:MAG TPA: hypothetical protein VM367_06385 [Pseudonocardia sp.]|nr:hypothetical protein [Pseudonocardia sp.]
MADRVRPVRRRRPDPVALLAGLLTLGTASAAFRGTPPDLGGLDPRWVLAAAAVLLGLVLLASSLRPRR